MRAMFLRSASSSRKRYQGQSFFLLVRRVARSLLFVGKPLRFLLTCVENDAVQFPVHTPLSALRVCRDRDYVLAFLGPGCATTTIPHRSIDDTREPPGELRRKRFIHVTASLPVQCVPCGVQEWTCATTRQACCAVHPAALPTGPQPQAPMWETRATSRALPPGRRRPRRNVCRDASLRWSARLHARTTPGDRPPDPPPR